MSIFGRKQHFSNLKFSVFEPFYLLFTSKLGNLICQGRPWAAKKVKNSHQNIIKVAKTPYFITYLGFSPGSICRFCWKVVQMCSFACPSTSHDRFGCPILAGLMQKKTALCLRHQDVPFPPSAPANLTRWCYCNVMVFLPSFLFLLPNYHFTRHHTLTSKAMMECIQKVNDVEVLVKKLASKED